jgi:hypothetical protein
MVEQLGRRIPGRPLVNAGLEDDRSRNAIVDYELLAVEVPDGTKLAARHAACPHPTRPVASAPRKLAVARPGFSNKCILGKCRAVAGSALNQISRKLPDSRVEDLLTNQGLRLNIHLRMALGQPPQLLWMPVPERVSLVLRATRIDLSRQSEATADLFAGCFDSPFAALLPCVEARPRPAMGTDFLSTRAFRTSGSFLKILSDAPPIE